VATLTAACLREEEEAAIEASCRHSSLELLVYEALSC
jgi:hypothetical protein